MSERLGDFEQNPTDRLDYDIDAARWLADGDTIVNVVSTSHVGTAIVDQTWWGDTSAKLWIMGGADGDVGDIDAVITSNLGRIVKVCFRLRIREC